MRQPYHLAGNKPSLEDGENGTSGVLDELFYDEKFWLKVKMKDLLHTKEMIAPSLGN